MGKNRYKSFRAEKAYYEAKAGLAPVDTGGEVHQAITDATTPPAGGQSVSPPPPAEPPAEPPAGT